MDGDDLNDAPPPAPTLQTQESMSQYSVFESSIGPGKLHRYFAMLKAYRFFRPVYPLRKARLILLLPCFVA